MFCPITTIITIITIIIIIITDITRYGHDLRWAISNEFEGDVKIALKSLVTPVEELYAKRLRR
jgi:hypothetical protein